MHYAMPSPLGEKSVVNDFTTHILCYDEPDCVTGETVSTLLVQEDKRYLEGRNPEPQLFAEAVAISQFHNSQLHLTWTTPIFYNCSCRMLSIQPKLPIFAQAGAFCPVTSRTAEGRLEVVRQWGCHVELFQVVRLGVALFVDDSNYYLNFASQA